MSAQRFDVAVIGGGPAGIAAAISASDAGGRVVLLDEGLAPGGQIWRDKLGASPKGAEREWKTRLASIAARVQPSTSVVDIERVDDGFSIVSEQAGTPTPFNAATIILATGARERFLPFPGWTLPNIVGVGGGQALLKSGMNVRGRRVIIAGSGPLLLPVAASMAGAGAKLVLVAEQASLAALLRFSASLWRTPAMIAQAVRLRTGFATTRFATGSWVTSAEGVGRVERVTITNGRSTRTLECDLLCAAFGLVPNTELARLLRCEVRGGAVVVDDRQMTSIEGVFCAGEPTGIGGVDLSLVEGTIAGLASMQRAAPAALRARRERLHSYAARLEASFALRPDVTKLATSETIVCRCEDVRFGDLDRAWTARQAKLYTRAGMGACQGRICGAALECVMGWQADSVRPPVQPARLSTMLGVERASDSLQGVP